MSRNKNDTSNKTIKGQQKQPSDRPSPTWPQEHKTKNQEEETSRRNKLCNDSTVTHTCCSFVCLSEKKAKERTNTAMTARSPTPAAHL